MTTSPTAPEPSEELLQSIEEIQAQFGYGRIANKKILALFAAALAKQDTQSRIAEAKLAKEHEITKWRGADSEEEIGYQKGISAQIRLQNRKQDDRIKQLQQPAELEAERENV